ncbi:cupredoxin domain-containing protein [Aneurinibacillus sp. Ricciae_BoGa-3]|uniref:cupredoxin domain-containing protein n=1 Tax=Aneurinibacillus sp. Ricciae_BoGa-3 TaxID=3022697 RepID=UPI002341B5B3|nr:cupredoxin domain-containing protein [Aneurinibacillus sp. Ricciae_BoGa-3]WCK53972.1 cupredoxin domain-containing protein [Aneurinibacillus sp. Ricciae_BoGa-3]
MKKKLILPVMLLVLNAAFFVYSREHAQRVQTHASTPQAIAITAAGFSPNKLVYRQGGTVSLSVHNIDSKTHNFIIRDYYIFSRDLKPGEVTTMEFKAVKKGTFPIISDTPGFPEPGYKGELIVN